MVGNFSINFSMVDGKVTTILSEVTDATTSCSICCLSSSNLNDPEKVYRVAADFPDIKFKHDLSTFHLWIRSMKCFLHIANKLDFKKWQARGGNKELLKLKKKQIQVALRGGLGITVDVPKSGGSGNSNNGNTARRFFRGYQKSAEVLGVDEELMKRFYITLCILPSKEEVDPNKLYHYNLETARPYTSLYNWYHMPQAIHKMLAHIHQIVSIKVISAGSLLEEPLEYSNKVFKHNREHHTRKFSRPQTNDEDVLQLRS